MLPLMKEDLYLDELKDIDASYIDILLDTLKVQTAGSRIRFQRAVTKLLGESVAVDINSLPTEGEPKKPENPFIPKLPKAKPAKKPQQTPVPLQQSISIVQDAWKIPHEKIEYTKRLGAGASGTTSIHLLL